MYTDVQRWPSDQSEYDEERVQAAPRIVLMGSRRSGKTSMERVVFGKMSPHETLFVASTSTPTLRLVANSELVHFAIFDIPGGCELGELSHHGAALTPMAVFSRCVVLVYVVDAEADPYAECARLAEVVALARRVNPRVGLGAAKESEIPNFKGSYLGRFPLVSADFWTSDHLSERSRSVDAFSGTRARGTLTLKRR